MSLLDLQFKLYRKIEKTHSTIKQFNMVQSIKIINSMLHQMKELQHSTEEPKPEEITTITKEHIQ